MKTLHLLGAVVFISSTFLACGHSTSSMSPDALAVEMIETIENAAPSKYANDEIFGELPEGDGNVAPSVGTLGITSWTPTGTRGRESKAKCRASRFRHDLRRRLGDLYTYGDSVTQLFDECEADLMEGSHIGLLNGLKVNAAAYSIYDSPHIKEVRVRFSNGETIHGFLGLKPDNKPRPFIIARCGVFCNIGGGSTRVMMMHLFDETPFHVLLLASTTGRDFVDENQTFAIGGAYEAAQHMTVAGFVTSPASGFADRISSVHVFGLSLGGNAAVMSSVVSQNNRLKDGSLPIKSVFALCPVENLDATLDDVFRETPKGFVMGRGAWALLTQVHKFRGQPVTSKPGAREILRQVSEELGKKYAAESLTLLNLNPFSGWTFNSEKVAWNANRFLDFADKIETPTFVFTSNDDPVVSTEVNAARVAEHIKYLRYKTNVYTLIVPQGGHCAESVAYGWNTISEMIKSYFLNFSPEFMANEHAVTFSIGDVAKAPGLRLARGEQHFSQKWQLASNSNELDLTFKIFSPALNTICARSNPASAYEGCFREATVRVPLSPIYAEGWITIPRTKAEADSITRWANTNLEVYAANNVPLNYTDKSPAQVGWLSY